MPPGIGQVGHAAPAPLEDGPLQPRAVLDCAGDGRIDVLHDEIQVHGRPVPRIVAPLRMGLTQRRRAGRFTEQVDGAGPAQQFSPIGFQPAARLQAEPGGVEADGLVDVADVDADADIHGCLQRCRRAVCT